MKGKRALCDWEKGIWGGIRGQGRSETNGLCRHSMSCRSLWAVNLNPLVSPLIKTLQIYNSLSTQFITQQPCETETTGLSIWMKCKCFATNTTKSHDENFLSSIACSIGCIYELFHCTDHIIQDICGCNSYGVMIVKKRIY